MPLIYYLNNYMENIYVGWPLFLFVFVAFLYSSVGHGGASGYLALFLLLFPGTSAIARPLALWMNLLVAGMAWYHFHQKKVISYRMGWMFLLGSVPASFLGSMWVLTDDVFKICLGVILCIPAIRLWIGLKEKSHLQAPPLWIAVVCGMGLGLISGMLGIGGGILLTPLLIFAGWSKIREAAGLSAMFIVCNSMAGLAGKWALPDPNFSLTILCAVLGGWLGAAWGSKKAAGVVLQRVLGTGLYIAAFKLIFL